MCMSAGIRRATAVVFLLVLDAQSLVGGVRQDEHPSTGLASLVLVTSTSSPVQSNIFSRWIPGKFVQL